MLCACASVARAEADHAAIARAALTEVIRPGYAAFADTTSALSEKGEALCKQPTDATLKEARDAFAAAVDAWSKIEIYRLRLHPGCEGRLAWRRKLDCVRPRSRHRGAQRDQPAVRRSHDGRCARQ